MINTTEQGNSQVSVIATYRVEDARIGGKYTSDRLEFIDGCTVHTLNRGKDGAWRYSYINTYGNGGFVTGEAVGASGFVVTDRRVIDRLDYLFALYTTN